MTVVSTITVKIKTNKTLKAWLDAQLAQASILYNTCLERQMNRVAQGEKPFSAFDLAQQFRSFNLASDYKDRIFERVADTIKKWIKSEPFRYQLYWQHLQKEQEQHTETKFCKFPFLHQCERDISRMKDYRAHVKSLARKQLLHGKPRYHKSTSLAFSIRPNRQETVHITKRFLSIRVPKFKALIKGYYNLLPTTSRYLFKLGTIKQDRCGDYWLKLTFEESGVATPATETKKDVIVGIDMGLKTTRTAVAVHVPTQSIVEIYQPERERHFEKGYNALVWASNRDKRHLPYVHRKIARRRLDNINKDVHKILEMGSEYKFGKPGSAFLLSGRLAKSASDAANSLFLTRFAKRAERAGKESGEVDESYTSVTCRRCQSRKAMPLKERLYECPVCSHREDRDVNSAYQIAFRNFRQRPGTKTTFVRDGQLSGRRMKPRASP